MLSSVPTVDEDTMRTTTVHHRRSQRPVTRTVALAAGVALLLTACGSGTPDASPSPAPGAVVAVHLVRSGPTEFFIEPVPVTVPAFGDALSARITAAIDALVSLEPPDGAELSTNVPAGTTLHRVSVDGAVATLDLSGTIVGSTGGSAQEVTFAQQLAHTARVDDSITGIRLLIDGQPITELWGHLDWSGVLAVDPFILSPVTVTTPLADEQVAVGTVTFRGQATVFEATVLVALLDGNGDVLEEGFVTATAGGPDRGTWEWTVVLPTAGGYMVVAGESDPSGGEGRPAFSTTRTVRAIG